MADFRNSLGWLALQARADWEAKQQAKAAGAEQLRFQQQQAGLAQAKQLGDQVDKAQGREIELAKLAGDASAFGSEPPPEFGNERMNMIRELTTRFRRGQGQEKFDLENLRQRDDLARLDLAKQKDERLAKSFGKDPLFFKAANQMGLSTSEALDPKYSLAIGRYMEGMPGWVPKTEEEANRLRSSGADKTSINTGDYVDPVKKLQGELQSELVNIDTLLPQFDEIRKAADPRLFGGGGAVRDVGTTLANVFMSDAPPEFAQQHASRKALLQTQAGALVTSVIKATSGLAASEPEAARIYRMALGVKTDKDGNLELSGANVQQMQTALDAYEAYMRRRQSAIKKNSRPLDQGGGIYVGEGEDPRNAPKGPLSPADQAELDELRKSQGPQ